VKRILVLAAVILPLAACSWFGGGKNEEQAAVPPATPGLTSDQVLQRDCASEQWKQQNLGLWYSVCRQPMKW
jgi:hypothetical protein